MRFTSQLDALGESQAFDEFKNEDVLSIRLF